MEDSTRQKLEDIVRDYVRNGEKYAKAAHEADEMRKKLNDLEKTMVSLRNELLAIREKEKAMYDELKSTAGFDLKAFDLEAVEIIKNIKENV